MAASRLCPGPGGTPCPTGELVPATPGKTTRCDPCRLRASRARAAQRGTTTQRGYGTEHQGQRARMLPHAIGQPCRRCGRPMLAGQALDLGHTDDRDPTRSAPEHAGCNRGNRTA